MVDQSLLAPFGKIKLMPLLLPAVRLHAQSRDSKKKRDRRNSWKLSDRKRYGYCSRAFPFYAPDWNV